MLNVGLVGFGWWGRHIAERLAGHDGFKLCAVAEKVQALHADITGMQLKAVDDLTDLLGMDDVEAIILTSPNDLHDSQVAACVAAGKHVFCEKPLSLTAKGARSSVEACRNAGLVLGVGHERRFEPAIQALYGHLQAGDLGNIMHAELAFSHNKLIGLDASSWRTSSTYAPAAGMTQMGIHLTDMLVWFFGRVTEIHAITADRSLGWETGDVVTVQMRFEAGMTATMQAILHTPHFLRTHIFGSEEWIEIRNETHPDTPDGEVRMERYRAIDDRDVKTFEWTDSVTANLEAWATAIAGDAPYPYSDFEMIHNIEVLEAIITSASKNRVVMI